MKKIISLLFFSIYILIVTIITIYVLNINKYNVSQIGNYSFVTIYDNNLIILNNNSNVNIGDEIYYYDIYSRYSNIEKQKIINKEVINSNEIIYTLEDNHILPNNYFIGNADCTIIPTLGLVINILSSTLGYLLFMVLPTLFILIYFVYNLRKEIKNNK